MAFLDSQRTSRHRPDALPVAPMGLQVMRQALPLLAAFALLIAGCAMPDRFDDAGGDEAETVGYMPLIPDGELRNRAPDPDEFAEAEMDG